MYSSGGASSVWAFGQRTQRQQAMRSGKTFPEVQEIKQRYRTLPGGNDSEEANEKESALLRPSTKMRTLSRQAHQLARNTQVQHSIVMTADSFALRTQPSEGDKDDSAETIETYTLEPGTKILIQPWSEKTWREPKNEPWNFYSSGICDPIRIRFETADGSIETEFNPLTGKVTQGGQHIEIEDKS